MPSDPLSTPLEQILFSCYFTDGFLPPAPAVTRLPDTWRLWEDLLSEAVLELGRNTQLTLTGIPASRSWRYSIQEMPILPTEPLHHYTPNLLRARQVLTFLLHFYIHSLPSTSSPIRIPAPLSIPLCEVSRCVGLPPICTYSDTIYYNYSYPRQPDRFGALKINCTFTSTPDEAHFYRTQVLIEHRGADAMKLMRLVFDAVYTPSQSSLLSVSTHLNELAVVIDDINRILCDVRTDCEPGVFYNEVRPWLSGGKLIFEGTRDGKGEAEEWAGSSAAQSSTIQALDAFLGIDELTHQPNAEYDTQKNGKAEAYLTRMRSYLPVDHRAVLDGLSVFGKLLRSYIINNSSPESPSAALVSYNSVINAMKDFRTAHIRVATLYIVSQRKEAKSMGTGGTELLPFLKNVRDQTTRALV